MNVKSGADWGSWSVAIEFELAIQVIAVLVNCLILPEKHHQSPSLLIFPVFLPIIGSAFHIWKDHLSQGLACSVAHCTSGLTSYIAFALGFLGFVATFHPVYHLLVHCHANLRMAHFPTVEASPSHKNVEGLFYIIRTRQFRKVIVVGMRMATNSMISSITIDKEIRAKKGELPHLALHSAFLYFFGGSPFIGFGAAVSMTRTMVIPITRIFAEKNVSHYGCSEQSARLYLIDLAQRASIESDVVEGNTDAFLQLAQQNGWDDILMVFFPKVSEDDPGWAGNAGGRWSYIQRERTGSVPG